MNRKVEKRDREKERGWKGRWYEKYLPFVARSQERQIEWLLTAFRKKTLTAQDLTPYVRLLMAESDVERIEHQREIFSRLEAVACENLLTAADIYDAPKILRLMPSVSVRHAVIALAKEPPPYEGQAGMVIDKVYQTLHEISDSLLRQAAEQLLAGGSAPSHFVSSYERFKEVLQDQEFLSALYPRAKG